MHSNKDCSNACKDGPKLIAFLLKTGDFSAPPCGHKTTCPRESWPLFPAPAEPCREPHCGNRPPDKRAENGVFLYNQWQETDFPFFLLSFLYSLNQFPRPAHPLSSDSRFPVWPPFAAALSDGGPFPSPNPPGSPSQLSLPVPAPPSPLQHDPRHTGQPLPPTANGGATPPLLPGSGELAGCGRRGTLNSFCIFFWAAAIQHPPASRPSLGAAMDSQELKVTGRAGGVPLRPVGPGARRELGWLR